MRGKKYTIGLDLGDRRHHVCALNGSGEIVTEEVIPNARETLLVLSARFPRATVIMETGTHCSTHRPLCGRPLVSPSAALRAARSRDHLRTVVLRARG